MASKKEAKKQYQHYVPAVRVVPDWYKNFNFVLITSMEELEKVFSNVETKKFYMGFDTETTGLNFEELELVGYSFCLDGKTSYYVPIYHFEYEFNLGEPAVEFIYQKMCEANKVFMYNARYDMRVFEFRGYKENRDKLSNKRFKYVKYDMSKVDYYDVAVPVWNSDTNQKMPSLKWASAHFLGFEQMHFDEVVEGAGNFFYLNPSDNFDAVYYAAADALCTYLLVPVTMKYFQEGGLATKVDNKVLYPLMHYEEEKLRLDKEKVSSMLSECQEEADRLEREVYDMLGFQINLRSPVQVAQAFQRLGIDTGEKTESGGMATGIKVLEGLSDEVKEKFPALKSFVQYKETAKLLNSYFEVLQKEADRNGFLRGAYQTTNVPTGRLSAGKDAKNTYFSPMNLQALPKPHVLMYDVFDTGDRYLQDSKNNIILGYKFVPAQYDTDGNHIVPTDPSYMGLAEGMNPKLNVRSCIIPKTYEDDDVDEWVYCAADYAAQELRITANISREPVWMDAFMHGRDVHRSTAEKLWGAENYNKDLRKRAKGCFSIDSLLYTSNGAERCLNIKNGTLLGLDGGEQDFGYVIEDRDGYEIELSNGGKFEVTSDHKFLLLDSFDERWVTADSLEVGSQLGVLGLEKFGGYKTVSFNRDRKNEERSVVFDEGLAYVCGLYLGDGYLSERNFTVLVKRDNFDYVKGILERYGSTSIQSKSDESGWYVLISYKKQFRDWVFNTFGSKKDKHINDIVYQSPKSVMLSFLAGLLDSDGKIGGCIEYSSKIRSLCCELGQLATLLGYTVISIKRNYSIYKGNRVYYYVVRLAYEDSIKEIPLMIKRSVDNINDRITSFIGYSILESERDKFKSLGKYADRGNFTDGKSVRLSRRISEKIGDWRYKYIPVSVVSIIPKKIKAFIMECESHYFIGNGLPSHNCNFGIIYGMGASSLVDPHYGINTLAEAEEFFNNYKSALPTLFQWIDRVQRSARRKGTVSTYFGRPRRLRCYYEQHNAGFANRTAVNTQIQGTAGDMLKIVMCRLWNNLLDNPDYRDDVRFMITIHDEIGYAVRRSRVYEIMDLIEKNQTIVLKEWPVPIITEISAGTSVGNIFAFEKYEDSNSKTGFYYRPKLD